MSQILHIFRKDARRHWPEILAYLCVLAVFTAYQPRVWTDRPIEIRFLESILKVWPVLLILTSVFLIIRLVQGETLVGDRQFWITRPYEWHKLLAAKLLAIFVFIQVPLFVAQILLLKLALFPLTPAIKGLLFIHWSLAITLVLASLALASITSGIGQASLGLLGAILLVIGIAALTTVIPNMDLASDTTDNWQEAVYLCGCIAAIVTQYVFRKTLLARLIVAGGFVLVFLLVALPPYGKLVARSFPLPTAEHPKPAEFVLDRALSFDHATRSSFDSYGDEVRLQIPFELSHFADNTLVQVRGVKLDLDLPAGEHWSSQWESIYDAISFDRKRYWPTIAMKREVFNRAKNAKIRAHVALALNVFRLGSETEVRIKGDTVKLPSGARCLNKFAKDELQCFAALRQPGPMVIVAALPNASCPIVEDAAREPWAATPASYENLAGDGNPEVDFTPIQEFTVTLSRFYILDDLKVPLPICAGTPLILNRPKFVYSTRAEIDLGEIRLENYWPTYPRKIVPPTQKWLPGERSDTLSWNFSPQFFTGAPKSGGHLNPR
jgi:hypothetical protein